MRFDRCALCGKFVLPDAVISLETSSKQLDGLSLEICHDCEFKLKDTANKNYFVFLAEEAARGKGDSIDIGVADTPEKHYLEILREEELRNEESIS